MRFYFFCWWFNKFPLDINVVKILICVIIAAGIAFAAFTAYEYSNLIDETEIQTYNTEKGSFKVAVISDTQLAPTEEELEKGAINWELKHGGFSGRSARQFIEFLAGKKEV